MSLTLYNFRGEASDEHQAFLVQVVLEFLGEVNAHDFFIAHDSRPYTYNVVCMLLAMIPQEIKFTYLGLCSTPAVAFACKREKCSAVVITASHNPWNQIGLKLFNKEGLPLSPTAEEDLNRRCKTQHLIPMTFPLQRPVSLIPPALKEYFDMLRVLSSKTTILNASIEVGNGWLQDVQNWLPRIEITGAERTDPSTTIPIVKNKPVLMRVDEDLDKLILWLSDQEVPNQLLLMSWLTLRPIETVCLSFDVTLFIQRHLQRLGYHIVTCSVGDQFVAETMFHSGIHTGGEPNGHYIAAERSFSPDALASALDLLKKGNFDFSWLKQTKESYYCRGIISPYTLSLEETLTQIKRLPDIKGWQLSYLSDKNAIVAENEKQRVILRISHFEHVAVIQTEGANAESLFRKIISYFPTRSIERFEHWIG